MGDELEDGVDLGPECDLIELSDEHCKEQIDPIQQEQSEELAEGTQDEQVEKQDDANENYYDEDDDDEKLVVSLQGMPFSASPEQITNFLEGCIIVGGEKGIHLVHGDDGRPNGNAFVELASQEDVTLALAKNKKSMGHRYVEVFQVEKKDMDYTLRQSSDRRSSYSEQTSNEAIVRLRGLPYGCTKEEVANFFLGLAIAPNGITILTDHLGRTAGDGFVQFTSTDLVEKALIKHKEKIKHRYIEVYKSSFAELDRKVGKQSSWSGSRSGPYDRPGRGPMGRNVGGNVKSLFDTFSGDYGGGFGRSGFGGGYGSGFGGRTGGGMSGGFGRNMRGSGGGNFVDDEFISRTGHFVHMRGLPFSCNEDDIAKFFDPLVPTNIVIEYLRNGRKSGNANVDFHSARDAKDALKKHKHMMGPRYVELYLNTTSPPGRSGRR